MKKLAPEGVFTELYARHTQKGFRHFYKSRTQVRMCLADYSEEGDAIRRVRVRKALSGDPKTEFWGWWDHEHQCFSMVYPSRMAVEVCFPYGSKSEEERGRGELCELFVEEISQ